MRAAIIDDESLAREELRYLLKDFHSIEIVGEAENISSAQTMIANTNPDLLFLDINMPGGTGFELLEQLTQAPGVIFTTAYDQYAIDAFEVNALDYLVKPIDEKRLHQALNKALDAFANNSAEKIRPDKALSVNDKVFVKDRDKCWFVKVGDIKMLESVGNYTKIYFENHKPMIKRTLVHMEERLPGDKFLRANRKVIINLDYIDNIEPVAGGQLELTTLDKDTIEMSRRQSQVLRELKSF